mmetsp:Transcript_6520/g.11833  ORF Transcript_6520/g.11833 Transcript_6520/m.11833 type:complete len:227 (-) Transcript_6520:1188-1868(-)
MIRSPGHAHDSYRFDLIGIVIDKSWQSLYFTHGSDCNLRRKDHRRHVCSTNRTDVTQSERMLAYVISRKIPFSSQRVQSPQLHGNLQHAHPFASLHHRHRQPPLRINSHPNIMPRAKRQRHFLNVNRRIQRGVLHQRQARRLDEERHIRELRHSHRLRQGTQHIAHFGQGVDVDLVAVSHVWDLEGGGHAFDHEAVVSADGDYGIFVLWRWGRSNGRWHHWFLSKG